MAPNQGDPAGVRHDEGFFSARNGMRLFKQSFLPDRPRAHVVFIHGYGDHSGRWSPLYDFLSGRGYAVHAFDLRGHGQSGGRRAHIEAFDEYLHDLTDFLGELRRTGGGAEQVYLIGHSLGGLLAVRWLLDRPEGVVGVVLSSPFFALAFEPPALKVVISKIVGRVIPFLPVKSELRIEWLTADPEIQRRTAQDPLYVRVVTPRWFTETLAAQAEIRMRASEVITPLLLMHAGADQVADPAVSRSWFDAVTARDKTMEILQGFQHEIFNDVERERAFAVLGSWLDARTA